jgi:hypothetical protein
MRNQMIVAQTAGTPAEVVRQLGAVQAQDFAGSLWAIGLRTRGATQSSVEAALNSGAIVRTWPMRGTLHVVASEDVRWILDLLSHRVVRGVALRSEKRFGLDERGVASCATLIRAALESAKALTRPALYDVLERGGVSIAQSRGLHILGRLALDQLICFGPRDGKQQTFVLFDAWVPKSPRIERDEALGRLALRYFSGHGPAQIHDFAWWSGLSVADVKRGIHVCGHALESLAVDGRTHWHASNASGVQRETTAVHLLPPFDEFFVAYRDRSALLEAVHAKHVNPGSNGMLSPIVVIDGQVLGTWKRVMKRSAIEVITTPFTTFTAEQRERIEDAASRYRAFVGA